VDEILVKKLDEKGPYIYIDEKMILKLPSFEEVTCDQKFPGPMWLSESSAGAVMHQGKKELMVCGGIWTHSCWLWKEEGWITTYPEFKRDYAGSSTIAGKLIITGGYGDVEKKYLTSSKIYSEDGGWEDLPDIPERTYRHCQVTVGDTVYIMGGYHARGRLTAATYKLTMPSEQWEKVRSLNTARAESTCAEWAGGVVVVGGYNRYNGRYLSSVEWYNPVNDTWSFLTPLPTSVIHPHSVVWENDLYVFGGFTGRKNNMAVFKLEPGQDMWQELGVTLQSFISQTVFPAVILDDIHCN